MFFPYYFAPKTRKVPLKLACVFLQTANEYNPYHFEIYTPDIYTISFLYVNFT